MKRRGKTTRKLYPLLDQLADFKHQGIKHMVSMERNLFTLSKNHCNRSQTTKEITRLDSDEDRLNNYAVA